MSTIPVYLRLKPKSKKSVSSVPFLQPNKESVIVKSKTNEQHEYKFTEIFDEKVQQEEIFQKVCLPLVDRCLNGQDSIMFTLGSSNSGKTYSIFGKPINSVPGLAFLTLESLFQKLTGKIAKFDVTEDLIKSSKNTRRSIVVEASSIDSSISSGLLGSKDIDHEPGYAVYLSMAQIYNDDVLDLLDSKKFHESVRPTLNNVSLDVGIDPDSGRTIITPLTKVFVKNISEAARILSIGRISRKVQSTSINNNSSRSHAFIFLEIRNFIKNGNDTEVKYSNLTIADLAGSERTKAAHTQGVRLTEGISVNKSLMQLGLSFQLLKKKSITKGDLSSLRSNKLTRLLLSDAVTNINDYKVSVLIAVDPFSDPQTNMQIFRYMALASQINTGALKSLSTPQRPRSRIIKRIEPPQSASNTSGDNDVLSARVAELEEENSNLQDRLISIEYELREELATEYEFKFEELQDQFQNIRIDDDESNQQSNDKMVEMLVQSYEGQLHDLREQTNQLVQNITESQLSYDNSLEHLLKENSNLKRELKDLKLNKPVVLSNDVLILQEQINKLNDELNDALDVKSRLIKLASKYKRVNHDLSERLEESSKFEGIVSKVENNNQKLNEENEYLRGINSNYKSSIKELQDSKIAQEQEIERLQKELQQANNHNNNQQPMDMDMSFEVGSGDDCEVSEAEEHDQHDMNSFLAYDDESVEYEESQVLEDDDDDDDEYRYEKDEEYESEEDDKHILSNNKTTNGMKHSHTNRILSTISNSTVNMKNSQVSTYSGDSKKSYHRNEIQIENSMPMALIEEDETPLKIKSRKLRTRRALVLSDEDDY